MCKVLIFKVDLAFMRLEFGFLELSLYKRFKMLVEIRIYFHLNNDYPLPPFF